MKPGNLLLILGLSLIVIGLSLLARFNSLSVSLADNTVFTYSPLWPKFIGIKSISLEAEIVPGGYRDEKWVLTNDKALFLPTSSKLGEGGNTIIYAHNTENLFGNLKKISIGETIVINDAKGKIYSFKVYSKEYISPYKMGKIATNLKDTVTLFTCDGWFDEKRLVIKAQKETKEITRLEHHRR